MKIRSLLALAATASVAFSACTSGATPSPSAPPSVAPSAPAPLRHRPSPARSRRRRRRREAASVRLQLQWTPQAQFAGYFAADKQGYYKAENLTVEFLPGGPTIAPHTVGSASNGPEFTISWVPKVLEAREAGSDLVDIAQVFQRSGTLSVTWKDSGITDPCGFAGKKVGVWDFGNEYEVTAGALACGLTPGLEAGGDPTKTFQKVIQNFDMVAFLNREIDVAEAMIYNEYAQVLEATNPETGELYKPEDLNVIDWNVQRAAMLQDALFVRQAWLDEGNNRDIAVRFVRASLKGWIYCRDNQEDCIQYTVEAGSQLRRRTPALDDERDQCARLAVAGRRRDDGPGLLGPDRPDRQGRRDHQGRPVDRRLHDRYRRGGPRGHHRRRGRRGLHEGDRRGDPGRQLTLATWQRSQQEEPRRYDRRGSALIG